MATKNKRIVAAPTKLRQQYISNSFPFREFSGKEVNLTDVAEERGKLENQAFQQDIILKKETLIILFIFLAFETIIIFLFSFFQGISFLQFHLEEWSFKLLITATLLQITYMVKIAVQHLFPNKK